MRPTELPADPMSDAEIQRLERSAFARALEKREALRKYAAFVSRQMGIEILFGERPEPGERGAIGLPAPETLREDEIDLLYGVLLREAGRARHSDAPPESFACLPTANALLLAEALESARVENVLAAEFDGAGEILSRLRSEQVLAPGMARKAFGWAQPEPSEWEALCHLAASELFFGPSAPLERIAPEPAARAAREGSARIGLPELLRQSPPSSFADCAALASALHRAYFSGSRKDDSEPLRVAERQAALQSAQALLEKTREQIRILEPQAKALSRALSGKRSQSLERELARQREIERLSRQADPLRSAMGLLQSAFSDLSRAQSDLSRAQAAAAKAEFSSERACSASDRLQELLGKLEAARAALSAARAAGEETKAAKLEDRLASLEARAESARKALQAQSDREARRKDASAALAKAGEDALREALRELEDASRGAGLPPAAERSLREALRDLARALDAPSQIAPSGAPGEAAPPATGACGSSGGFDGPASSGSAAGSCSGADASPLGAAMLRLQESMQTIQAPLSSMQESSQSLQSASRAEKSALREEGAAARALREQIAQLNREALEQAHQILTQAGLPSELMPEFVPTPGWEAADAAQKAFDALAAQELGVSVANGVGGGSLRAEIALGEALEAIDLSEFFRSRAGRGAIDSFSDPEGGSEGDASAGCFADPIGAAALESAPRHLASTTAFDTTRSLLSRKEGFDWAGELRSLAAPLARARRLFPAKMRAATKERHKGGQDEGRIDARSVWKLAAGMGDDFCEITRKTPHNRVSACVLADLSGSLDADPERSARLRQIAIVLSEGLSAASVRHEVLGHHAPHCPEMASVPSSPRHNRRAHRLETLVVRAFGSRGSEGLSHLEPQASDNCDGEALREAWKRLRREPTRQKALFVLTDGKPYLSDANPEILDADVRRAAREIRAQRGLVFGIGLGCSPSWLFGEEFSCRGDDWDSLFSFLERALSPPR